MLSGCGQPAFNLDHIPDAISLAFLVLIFGLEGGARAFIIICYVIGGLGIYRLAHSLVRQRQSALFAVAAYLLSWYVMRTTDFYVYTSNILQLVLLPWLVYYYRESARTGLVRPCLWAALLTAICILSNPQMAIKVVALAVAWIVCEWSLHQRHWRALVTPVRALGCIALAAGWLAAFHIAIALIHQVEIYSVDRQGAGGLDWQVFLHMPAFAANIVGKWLGMDALFDVTLWQVVDSHYWGLSVLLLALLALQRRRGRGRSVVYTLWILTLVAVVGYFWIGQFNATAWLGTPRKMLFIPVFCSALLCAYGHFRLCAIGRRRGGSGHWWGATLWVGLVGELGVLKLAFYLMGPHHLALDEIPQVEFWRKTAATQQWELGERFYTFKADIAFMLFPAFTGRPSANRIHQRDYTDQFFSYQDTLKQIYLKAPPYDYKISEFLALQGVSYLDLPEDGYSGLYRAHYEDILAHFAADSNLVEIARRYPDQRDVRWQRSAALAGQLSTSNAALPAQVLFANRRARFAFIADKTIALFGDPKASQPLFEKIALSPTFCFDKVLYIMPEKLRDLEQATAAVAGVMPAAAMEPGWDGKLPVYSFAEVAQWYASGCGADNTNGEVAIEHFSRYEIRLNLSPARRDRFVGLALQRFKDWHAYDNEGQKLKIFAAGAGMTAVHLPAGAAHVVVRYERPAYKNNWRLFSLIGFVVVVGLLLWRPSREYSLEGQR